MIILGLILMVLGWIFGISLLVTIGIVVAVIGLVLVIAQAVGHGLGGRYWW